MDSALRRWVRPAGLVGAGLLLAAILTAVSATPARADSCTNSGKGATSCNATCMTGDVITVTAEVEGGGAAAASATCGGATAACSAAPSCTDTSHPDNADSGGSMFCQVGDPPDVGLRYNAAVMTTVTCSSSPGGGEVPASSPAMLAAMAGAMVAAGALVLRGRRRAAQP